MYLYYFTIRDFLQAFEKKVKNQFSLVPFEEVTPVVEEVNLEEDNAKGTNKNGNGDGKNKKNGKDGEKAEEAENWGTVHDTPVTDDMEDDAETSATDLDKTEPFNEVEKEDEEKEKEKLKLKEKMENERKRAEEKEKEAEEARKAEEIRKTEEKKEKEEKRKAELREREEKKKQEIKEKEEKRKQELKEKEEKRKQEEQKKAEEKKKEDEQKSAEAKDKAEEDKVSGLKRKSKPEAGPARKVKKVDHSKPDEYWKVLRSGFMVGESALTLEELIETDVIERGVLVFLLDVSKTDEFFQDYFNKFENFESAERLLVEDRFSGVYLVTFEESESADDFVKLQRTLWDGTPLRKVVSPLWNNSNSTILKVGMREFCRDRYCEHRMIESLRNLDLIKGIDEKMNFPERRKAGTTQAHCLVNLLLLLFDDGIR